MIRKLTAIVVALLFVVGIASIGLAAESKCAPCHKGDKALDKIVAKAKIKTVAEFMKAVKEGPKAKIHAKMTDDDIKAAAKELKLAE